MKYKLVVTDMDGTLLNSNSEVSEKNKEALKYLHSKGVHVAVATGRIYATAKVYAKHLGLVTPIICCNGAMVKNLADNSMVYGNPISKENCLRIIDIFKEHGVYFHFYSEDTIYGENLEKKMLYFSEYGKTLNEEDRIKIEVVKNSSDIVNSDEIIYKFGFQVDDALILEKISSQISKEINVEVHQSLADMVDIMNIGVTKGKAVERLANSLGLHREEVIAIGDNHNDISMLEYAGVGIAMGNADEKVKKIADYVTETNNEDGVAKAIYRFIK